MKAIKIIILIMAMAIMPLISFAQIDSSQLFLVEEIYNATDSVTVIERYENVQKTLSIKIKRTKVSYVLVNGTQWKPIDIGNEILFIQYVNGALIIKEMANKVVTIDHIKTLNLLLIEKETKKSGKNK